MKNYLQSALVYGIPAVAWITGDALFHDRPLWPIVGMVAVVSFVLLPNLLNGLAAPASPELRTGRIALGASLLGLVGLGLSVGVNLSQGTLSWLDPLWGLFWGAILGAFAGMHHSNERPAQRIEL